MKDKDKYTITSGKIMQNISVTTAELTGRRNFLQHQLDEFNGQIADLQSAIADLDAIIQQAQNQGIA